MSEPTAQNPDLATFTTAELVEEILARCGAVREGVVIVRQLAENSGNGSLSYARNCSLSVAIGLAECGAAIWKHELVNTPNIE